MTGHIGGLDVERIRKDFPILARTVGDRPLVYLDSAATSPEAAAGDRRRVRLLRAPQRERPPRRSTCWARRPPSCSRAPARSSRAFFGAPGPETHRVHPRHDRVHEPRRARAGDGSSCSEGDEILLTEMEHHSNIVPWQMAAAGDRRDAPVHPARRTTGSWTSSDLGSLLTERTKILVGHGHVERARARSRRCGSWPTPRTRWARSSWWTPRSSCRTIAIDVQRARRATS